jgi:hypothetical protein
MDPLSVAGSLAGLITVAGKLCSILRSIICDVSDAPREVSWVLSEITATKTAIDTLQGLLRDIETLPSSRRGLIKLDALAIILSETVLTFEQLDSIIAPLGEPSSSSAWDRVKYAWSQSSISREMQRLQSHKSSILLILGVLHVSVSHMVPLFGCIN